MKSSLLVFVCNINCLFLYVLYTRTQTSCHVLCDKKLRTLTVLCHVLCDKLRTVLLTFLPSGLKIDLKLKKAWLCCPNNSSSLTSWGFHLGSRIPCYHHHRGLVTLVRRQGNPGWLCCPNDSSSLTRWGFHLGFRIPCYHHRGLVTLV